MGEPAEPSDKYRVQTQKLAAAIVESVRADESMPHPPDVEDFYFTSLDNHMQGALDGYVFRLAQEVTLLRAELDADRRALNEWRATAR